MPALLPHVPALSRRSFLASIAATAGLGLAGCTASSHTIGSAAAGSTAGSASAAGQAVTTVRVGALQGPTGMGLVGLMDNTGALADLAATNGTERAEDSPVGTNPAGIGALANSYAFTLAGSADELAPQLIQGELFGRSGECERHALSKNRGCSHGALREYARRARHRRSG